MIHRYIVTAILFVFVFTACGYKQQSASTPGKPAKSAKVSNNPKASNLDPSVSKEGITVLEAVSCKSIEDKAPVSENTKFPADVGRVHVFTKVKVDAQETSIKHIWHYQDKEVATVTLPVGAPQWRTYSSKQIDATYKGDWRVDITTEKGDILKSITFQIE